MSSLDLVIQKVPRPLLVVVVLAVALGAIFYSHPLKKGCDVEIENFTNRVRGQLINSRTAKKKQLVIAHVEAFKDFCKRGNSPGACENYLVALQKISEAFVTFNDECLSELFENENLPKLSSEIKQAVTILSLLAWGEFQDPEKPNRLGWLSKSEVYTFCRFKLVLQKILPEEEYNLFILELVKKFPAAWPEKYKIEDLPEDVIRPTVFKWADNPEGTMSQQEVIEKSLLSVRCDSYQ